MADFKVGNLGTYKPESIPKIVNDISQPMAMRILKELVDKGEVRAVGGGKNTRYVLNK